MKKKTHKKSLNLEKQIAGDFYNMHNLCKLMKPQSFLEFEKFKKHFVLFISGFEKSKSKKLP